MTNKTLLAITKESYRPSKRAKVARFSAVGAVLAVFGFCVWVALHAPL
jgi:hypothetical protein